MKTLSTLQIAIVLTAAIASTGVQAHGDQITSGTVANGLVTEVMYDNPAYNRGIHGYPNPVAPLVIAEKQLIYVDQAHGQAIYSYAGNTK
ncbi:hypothetical protein [Methylomonas albis]|uniref:Uncharacterized protein n=1 Tax=Methylomonas albis TaxID=1854563 RepID=A0ABR9D5S5_9GAMM|nr:hypothetical protein [Methylomonas albis]MBD9358136.1 hypothetical protein [Methylomonas albis]CAD6881507.1 hypothetical protein [Methylomonas albis]